MFSDDWTTIHHGDCLDVMRGMDADSIDAIVTDPPYGLSFMGRDWDHGVPGEAFWAEALRVAKPGAHLVAFGGTRTYHRLAVAIEDAGWEVRDCLGWLYGSGFPKSLDVSKAIDKEAGNERLDREVGDYGANRVLSPTITVKNAGKPIAAAAAAAAAYQGWGTALKPAWEPIILARKPLGSTVAACVQTWGTGALNIDECRVKYASKDDAAAAAAAEQRSRQTDRNFEGWGMGAQTLDRAEYLAGSAGLGRWPANIVHDGSDEVLAVFPQTDSGAPHTLHDTGSRSLDFGMGASERAVAGGSGSAARFFYTAKASKSERDDGIIDSRNTHPTVKPLDLMRWLVRLVTPPDGVVLDPFMGSGTTLKAARAEGHTSIGIDLEREHCEIAWGRLSQGVLL